MLEIVQTVMMSANFSGHQMLMVMMVTYFVLNDIIIIILGEDVVVDNANGEQQQKKINFLIFFLKTKRDAGHDLPYIHLLNIISFQQNLFTQGIL